MGRLGQDAAALPQLRRLRRRGRRAPRAAAAARQAPSGPRRASRAQRSTASCSRAARTWTPPATARSRTRDGQAACASVTPGSLRCSAAALERDIPVLGICRGAQLLNVLYGGSLFQHMPTVGHRGMAAAVYRSTEVTLDPVALPARFSAPSTAGPATTIRRSPGSARAWRSPAARRTAPSRPSSRPTGRSSSACSGTRRRTANCGSSPPSSRAPAR